MTSHLLCPLALLAALALGVQCLADASVSGERLRIGTAGAAREGVWNLWSNGSAGDWFESDRAQTVAVTLVAAGTEAKGQFPIVKLHVGGPLSDETLATFTIDSKEFKEYRFDVAVPAGVFAVKFEFTNDLVAEGEDRNVLVRELRVSGVRLAAGMPSIEALTEPLIRERRMGTLTIRTRPGAKVHVRQLRHAFAFGTALSTQMFREVADAADREKYLETAKKYFNAAVHENALKWYSTERQKGVLTWEDADRILAWCDQNHIAMRGHCIYWAADKYVQDWIKQLDDDTLRQTLERRGREVTSRFRGRIGEYDVNNEMVNHRYYANRLGDDIRVKMFQWAREGDPGARLYVNDYSVISGGGNLAAYEKQIEALIKAGAPVGGIGVQGHFGQKPDAALIQRALDRLARFKLPIKVTEFDINLDDEQARAEALETVYRVAFAHPAVDGILMWGFWEGAHWRAKAALWKRDWTPTESAKRYEALVYGKWWTNETVTANAEGLAVVRVFYGRHDVEADGKRLEVDVTRAEGEKAVEMPR